MSRGRWVTGWARVEVRGQRPERVLRGLAERGIAFWDASPPKDFALRLSISAREAAFVPKIAAALGCEGEILRFYGLPALWKKVKDRRALLVCLGAALVLLGLSRLFVWDIEIEGNRELKRGEVLAALSECGVDVGSFWPAFSQDMIRNGMLLRLPELRWMTVNIRGCHAHVILRERYEPEETLEEDALVKITAEKAGVVTEIHALRGTALAAVDGAVLPGETLIDGLASGRFESHGAIGAIGRVWARTWYEISASAPAETVFYEQDGPSRSRWALVLGKRRINFYKGYSICPPDCAKMTMETSLSAAGLFSLPVTLVRETFCRRQCQDARAPELREELEAQLYAELLCRIGEEGEILQSGFTASESEGLLTVTLRAECREEIGQTVPMSPQEIASKIPAAEEAEP